MTPAKWMTVLGYLGVAISVGVAALAYSLVGGGPGAAILAFVMFKFGVTVMLLVALLAVGFAFAEVRDSPVRTLPNAVTAGAASLLFLLLLITAVGLWFF